MKSRLEYLAIYNQELSRIELNSTRDREITASRNPSKIMRYQERDPETGKAIALTTAGNTVRGAMITSGAPTVIRDSIVSRSLNTGTNFSFDGLPSR